MIHIRPKLNKNSHETIYNTINTFLNANPTNF